MRRASPRNQFCSLLVFAFVETDETEKVAVICLAQLACRLGEGDEERRCRKEAVVDLVKLRGPDALCLAHQVPRLLLQTQVLCRERLIPGKLPQVHLAEEFNLDIENRAENFVCLRLLAEFFEADRNLILIRHIFASVPDARAERRRERQSLAEDGKCGLEIAGCFRLHALLEEGVHVLVGNCVFAALAGSEDVTEQRFTRRLQQDGYPIPEKLYLISYGNMALSQLMRPSITSISDGYEEFGRAALSISSLIEKNPSISTVNIQLHCQLNIRETTENRPLPVSAEDEAAEPVLENRFFKDPEISNLARLETLFQQCDEIDMALIQQLLSGDSYAQMTEKSFISETAVKYRIRKMEKTCGVGTRMDLVRFLKDFLERS